MEENLEIFPLDEEALVVEAVDSEALAAAPSAGAEQAEAGNLK